VYTNSDGIYRLYCFNGKTWDRDTVPFKKFLSHELYDFLKMILVELYFENIAFNAMKTQLKKLKVAYFKKEMVETYKEINTDPHLRFDDKWHLLGFTNTVYCLQENCFREYRYDDYVSITTGYEWREPTADESKLMQGLIDQIMPVAEERELYLQILSTCLSGMCVEKFVICNGSGRNGKGLIHEILLCGLQNYAMIGNNSILFETNKTGSNPERNNIHKKRLVIFREPPENKRFENSVIKELTGGGTFSSRGHHESTTKKELNLTMIVECNKRPTFAEEPTVADVERIIDVYFRSTYTQDESLVNHSAHIYLANPLYKTNEFQQQHKFALMRILMSAYSRYRANGNILALPETIKQRTAMYLELSYNIVQWFKDTYEYTGDKKHIIKMKDLYMMFASSGYFANLSKTEKRKYNKTFFSNYVQENMFFKAYYHERYAGSKNCISMWQIKADGDE
jgi:phage/plasmid-associated DNA primase